MKNFQDYQLYIFDLDNTLYSEKDYLFGGYDAIGTALNNKEIAGFLKTSFEKEGRTDLFNKMITQFQLDKSVISSCLEILRTYTLETKLPAYPDVIQLLDRLTAMNKKLAILTNGNPQQQRNKLNNISPAHNSYFPITVLANEIAPKPSPESVYNILAQAGIAKEETIMIGDDRNDEVTAQNAGIAFIYIDELRKSLK